MSVSKLEKMSKMSMESIHPIARCSKTRKQVDKTCRRHLWHLDDLKCSDPLFPTDLAATITKKKFSLPYFHRKKRKEVLYKKQEE